MRTCTSFTTRPCWAHTTSLQAAAKSTPRLSGKTFGDDARGVSMAFLVSFVGIGVAGIGLLGVAAPGQLADLLARWRVVTGLPLTLALRRGFGVLFVLAAPLCRLPHIVRLMGVVELIGRWHCSRWALRVSNGSWSGGWVARCGSSCTGVRVHSLSESSLPTLAPGTDRPE